MHHERLLYGCLSADIGVMTYYNYHPTSYVHNFIEWLLFHVSP